MIYLSLSQVSCYCHPNCRYKSSLSLNILVEEPKGLQNLLQIRKEEPEDQEGAVASRRALARLGGTTTSSQSTRANPRRQVAVRCSLPSSARNPTHSQEIPQRRAIRRSSLPMIQRQQSLSNSRGPGPSTAPRPAALPASRPASTQAQGPEPTQALQEPQEPTAAAAAPSKHTFGPAEESEDEWEVAGAAAPRVLTSQAGGRAPTLLDKHMLFVRRRLQLYRRRPTWIQPGVGEEPSLCHSLRQSRRGTRCARPLNARPGLGWTRRYTRGKETWSAYEYLPTLDS
ncbi:hypothetical protein DAPPUDRAFT_103769 [Daphnia pulex]|uniref:Uncharacterized protein n=1 Tax=Daphnia pulex TaxID=6669 RepID=E9GK82_DAPPU|nr:hypothetical protein DAPPUDRAFT_103769 [Daphnia pulex]|eukprot:EFX80107.1 hypothetical protein DAPPUDRAFT_103769 [Daphnia pulex]